VAGVAAAGAGVAVVSAEAAGGAWVVAVGVAAVWARRDAAATRESRKKELVSAKARLVRLRTITSVILLNCRIIR
jgi:hypothetical protein